MILIGEVVGKEGELRRYEEQTGSVQAEIVTRKFFSSALGKGEWGSRLCGGVLDAKGPALCVC